MSLSPVAAVHLISSVHSMKYRDIASAEHNLLEQFAAILLITLLLSCVAGKKSYILSPYTRTYPMPSNLICRGPSSVLKSLLTGLGSLECAHAYDPRSMRS